MSIVKQTCDRCFKKVSGTIMSMFNTDIICMKCKEKERQHPDYNRASKIELQAVQNGDRNFKGVGKPNSL